MSCGVGHRCSSDPALLCLWRRPAAAVLIHPLAWELPYAISGVLKRKKKMWYLYAENEKQTNTEERRWRSK